MRLPNGYGSVVKLSGKRRKKWLVRGPAIEKWDGEKVYYERPNLGTFETRAEALELLAEYNKKPWDVDTKSITFSEVYELCHEKRYEGLSNSIIKGYKTAYNKWLVSLHDTKMCDIKTLTLQNMINNCDKGSGVKRNIKIVINFVFEYALENDIIEKNYASFINYNEDDTQIVRKIYTPDEIKKLHTGELYDDIQLLLLYTGLRIEELLKLNVSQYIQEEQYICITKSKTKAGIRNIPVHSEIIPIMHKYAAKNTGYLLTNKGKNVSYRSTLERIKKIGHLPHDTRHSFSTNAKKNKMDEYILKRLMGHSITDITEKIYTHRSIDELREAIELIKYY